MRQRRDRRPRPVLRLACLILCVVVVLLLAVYGVCRRRSAGQDDTASNQATSANVTLQSTAMAAVLEVRCTNATAEVLINDKHSGRTPLTLPWRVTSRKPKTFHVSVQADGFQPHDQDVEMQPGEWRRLEVTLSPEAKPTGPVTGKVVCVDPGHPSEINDGLAILHGTSENHINWLVALELREYLQAAGLEVVMTKQSEPELVRNRRRAEIANDAGAELMVRLHCDTGDAGAQGFTLYYPDRAGRKGNDEGPPESVRAGSRRAAEVLHRSLVAGLSSVLRDNGVLTDTRTAIGSKQGALTGSIYSRVPVVTIEMVFLTNAADAKFIKAEEGQRRMARALADGVVDFIGSGQ